MGIYGDKKDYQELVKNNIEKANILNSIPREKHETALKLLDRREKIMQKNGIFAGLKLSIIDKKLKKMKK